MQYIDLKRFPELEYAGNEAMNTLCTNLTFCGADVKIILLTSCHASEGKTFVSMNLMRALTRLGKRVVFVDADLRRSMVVSRYGVQFEDQNPMGLAHYLAGLCEAEDILYATNLENAFFVPIGHDTVNSLSLLASPRLSALLHKLAENADFVLVDAPPVGLVIDAAEIAKFCDGTLLIASYDEVTRSELADAKAQIAGSGAKVLGAVLNGVLFDHYSNKKYYNKNYYSRYVSDYYQPKKRIFRSKRADSPKKRAES